MPNKNGKLVTSKEELKETALLHVKKVLENRPIKSCAWRIYRRRKKLCGDRINSAKRNIRQDWEEKDVKYVIRNFKKKKFHDPLGYSNEVIQCGGKDILCATTKLMNTIKRHQSFPQSTQACNLTSIFKNKGSRKDFNHYRGIFWVTVFRNILDGLIFNDNYSTIEKNPHWL